MYLFGGYGDGGYARGYGRRGAESRGFAGHPGVRAASPAPAGGGRGGGKR
jgi:hypothetical protein